MNLYRMVPIDDRELGTDYQLLKDGQVIIASCTFEDGVGYVREVIKPGDEFQRAYYSSRQSYDQFISRGSISSIVAGTINDMPNEITEGEAFLFNNLYSMESAEVVSALETLVRNATHPFNSRAMDALLKLNDFDKVGYLINLFDERPEWAFALCEDFTRFPEPRAIQKLCDIVTHYADPDVRFNATVSLAEIGDETAIAVLEHVILHDKGEHWEGLPIADMAKKAMERIQFRIRDAEVSSSS